MEKELISLLKTLNSNVAQLSLKMDLLNTVINENNVLLLANNRNLSNFSNSDLFSVSGNPTSEENNNGSASDN